jgi:UDP-glucose:(heptosyl)LPS alpha-1,3-glucosyltransferase
MRIVDVPKRLRIALFTERFGQKFGGAESYAVSLFRILAQRHDVTVFAREFDHDLPVKQHVISTPSWCPTWLGLWLFSARCHELAQTGFDITHSHTNAGSANIQLMHVSPVRYRRFFNRTFFQKLLVCLTPSQVAYLWLESQAVKSNPGHVLVTVAPLVKQQLQVAYGPDLAVEVVTPGAEPVRPNEEVRQRVRAELGWGPQDIGCLLVARNPLRKGLLAVLRAMLLLPNTFRLAVVGTNADVQKFVATHFSSVLERVHLIPATPEVAPYYLSADVYVHPTLQDSFGMAPLEAMAHGLPVVLSGAANCGFAQYVTHRQNAWVLDDPHDAEQIAAGLRTLGTDSVVRERMIEQAAKLVADFSWAAIADQYENLYAKSLAERADSSGSFKAIRSSP